MLNSFLLCAKFYLLHLQDTGWAKKVSRVYRQVVLNFVPTKLAYVRFEYKARSTMDILYLELLLNILWIKYSA